MKKLTLVIRFKTQEERHEVHSRDEAREIVEDFIGSVTVCDVHPPPEFKLFNENGEEIPLII
jgi:hypothetical protein